MRILFLFLFLMISVFGFSEESDRHISITVGSTNKGKILAVGEVLQNSPHFADMRVVGVAAGSNVSEQPISLQETILGAKNRSKNAFNESNCTYSFGLESGLMEAPETFSGYLHVSACCIYDGVNYYTGLSTGFELPPVILGLILNEKMDLSQACMRLGISDNLIGVLTSGKIDRKEYLKQSVAAALIQLENYELYAIPEP